MACMPAVRRFAAEDAPAVTAIIRGLPDYFTDDVPAKAEHDAADHEAWVITGPDGVAGFAIAARKSPGGVEILWIAVEAARRGQGHGTRLLGHVLGDLAAAGVSVVEAKTLDASSVTSRTRPPVPSGSATASSRSTRSTRCPAGSRAIPPPSTSPPSVRPGESPAERAVTLSWIMVWGRGVRGGG